jgi:hypothetical protein
MITFGVKRASQCIYRLQIQRLNFIPLALSVGLEPTVSNLEDWSLNPFGDESNFDTSLTEGI